MEIISFKTLPSTQKYLIEQIESNTLKEPVAVIALNQNDGIGSRDNKWVGGSGNFFASIAINIEKLPNDLKLSSASIYFSFIMKKVLKELNENVWLKWPNDFYLENEKIGGTITKKVKNVLVCGIGINLTNTQNGYRALQADISPQILLEKYIAELEKFPKWKQVFSEYEVEFLLSKKFYVHTINGIESLADACLCGDGSLILGEQKVYSLR
ncbi:Biotin-protein ligase [hydrothermal vent metagenome]|uniref:Biotin-protein ligase n=1 Tax=hydrothermal vent metagenome TaxID=652676 RepID=A0A1W1EDA0_9ZZZZ